MSAGGLARSIDMKLWAVGLGSLGMGCASAGEGSALDILACCVNKDPRREAYQR